MSREVETSTAVFRSKQYGATREVVVMKDDYDALVAKYNALVSAVDKYHTKCDRCDGTGLVLNMAGEPDDCPCTRAAPPANEGGGK